MNTIENVVKPHCETPNLYTLTGEITIKREKKPIITSETFCAADALLYQLFKVYQLNSDDFWFPTTYVYYKSSISQWIRLNSKTYCEKLYSLFDVNSLEELKSSISKCERDRGMSYSGSFDCATVILSNIKIDEIGSMI